MAGYNERMDYHGQGENYWGDQLNQGSDYNFDMNGSQFGQELNFQSFDGSQPADVPYSGTQLYGANPYLNPANSMPAYHGEIFTPSDPSLGKQGYDGGSTDFDQEPPLMEVLLCAKNYFCNCCYHHQLYSHHLHSEKCGG